VKDAEAIHALLWTAKDDIPLKDHFSNDIYRGWVREQCRKRNFWIVERDDQLAGAMMMQVDEIRYLVTAAAHRKARFAQALIEHAKEQVRKKYRSGVWAQVKPSNMPIIRLLEKLNFVRDPDRVAPGDWICYCSSEADRIMARH